MCTFSASPFAFIFDSSLKTTTKGAIHISSPVSQKRLPRTEEHPTPFPETACACTDGIHTPTCIDLAIHPILHLGHPLGPAI